MNDRANQAFRLMGWGMVFPLLNLHIQGFDLIPDWIGYTMVLVALNTLNPMNRFFRIAKWMAVVLVSGSVAGQAAGLFIGFEVSDSSYLIHQVYSGLMSILHAALVYCIFNGLIVAAWAVSLRDLRHSTAVRRDTYFIIVSAHLLLWPFGLNLDDGWILVVTGASILHLVVEVLFVRLLFKFAKEYTGEIYG
ncbi:hypothetical protein [Paenibacillus tuaregi]|uniref:hypothetical protein n=1 Tax=Paenibacillus tuaregi TaxID=1816681 RepID=UPI0008382570|nr:hypothetical protein [Paenibacillus tuaregi]